MCGLRELMRHQNVIVEMLNDTLAKQAKLMHHRPEMFTAQMLS
jgi:hypothetical protein